MKSFYMFIDWKSQGFSKFKHERQEQIRQSLEKKEGCMLNVDFLYHPDPNCEYVFCSVKTGKQLIAEYEKHIKTCISCKKVKFPTKEEHYLCSNCETKISHALKSWPYKIPFPINDFIGGL